jgi:hypothetical protein
LGIGLEYPTIILITTSLNLGAWCLLAVLIRKRSICSTLIL